MQGINPREKKRGDNTHLETSYHIQMTNIPETDLNLKQRILIGLMHQVPYSAHADWGYQWAAKCYFVRKTDVTLTKHSWNLKITSRKWPTTWSHIGCTPVIVKECYPNRGWYEHSIISGFHKIIKGAWERKEITCTCIFFIHC